MPINTTHSQHCIITVKRENLSATNSSLRQLSRPVEIGSELDLESLLGALRETLSCINYGAGLSAIQIGVPYRVAIVNIGRTPETEIILINPTVLSLSGRKVERSEGCLSLPNYKAPIIRRNKITIETYDMAGQKLRIQCNGYEAAVIQHELDHMDGILYWDRIEQGANVVNIKE